jgi:hypothetical protein
MKHIHILVLLTCSFFRLSAQTGPNSPSSGVNNTSIGANAWTNPGGIVASDNSYASISVYGNTNYLFASNFGFAIPGPANVDGIKVEIEKSEVTPLPVALLDNWTNGLTKTISAGSHRCLIVVVATENGNSVPDVTGMTYGGQAMTQVLEIASGPAGGFSDKLEVWLLLESGIAAASGTTIVPVYAANTQLENVEFYTSAVFQNVDQFNPVYSTQTTASNSSANPHQLSSAFNTILDDMSITGVICGNNTTPASTSGGTNTYSINSSFTEGTDIYVSNPSFATSGICVQTATKACTVTGTEQPSFTFAGSVNRASMFGFTLQRARALDNSIYLLMAGSPTGINHGLPTVSWPTTDAYVTYGNSADVWGTTWSLANINSTGFGVALSASRSNGNLQVDHFRITVYTTSTLPIELLQFNAEVAGNEVLTTWVTATELNNDYFVVERTADGITFEEIGVIDGAGNSTQPLSYSFTDTNPLEGVSYYRLKQVDFNGLHSYSSFASVNFSRENKTTVYPNPSTDGVFTFLQDEQIINEVAVFSSDLKLVKKVMVATGEKAIVSITDQPDGIYFLIYSENGKRQVNKVQKMSREN